MILDGKSLAETDIIRIEPGNIRRFGFLQPVVQGSSEATVTLAIDKRYSQIPDDSAGAVFTSGLIGSQYVAIQPGGSPTFLGDGDQLILTQSALQLEDLIGKFLVNGSPSDNKSGGAQGGTTPDNSGKK